MDWSKIEDLTIDTDTVTTEVLQKLPPLSKSLQKLETMSLSFLKALPDNILTHLTWIGPSTDADFTTVLDRQGFSLQHLEFRSDELDFVPFRTNFNITMLHEKAPNLLHLSLNFPHNGTWPLESLLTLALLPNLRSPEIYPEIQSPRQQQVLGEYSMELILALARIAISFPFLIKTTWKISFSH